MHSCSDRILLDASKLGPEDPIAMHEPCNSIDL